VILEAAGVRFAYRDRPVVHDVNLRVDAGEMIAICGPNGAGKSTLLKLLSGYLEPQAGRIDCEGKDLRAWEPRALARRLAIAPQAVSFYFPFTVGQYVLLARHPHRGMSPFESEADLAAAHAALAQTGIAALAERSVLELSGGEKQRVVLAAALAQQPSILLLDEPTASLDLRHQAALMAVLGRPDRGCGVTVLLVTHDLNLAARWAPRLALMHDGRVVADGRPADILQADRLREIYGAVVEIGRRADGVTPYILPLEEAP